MYIGLSDQVRLVDKLTSEKYGTDSLTLMHNAANAVFDILTEKCTSKATVCILCGKGNNAGDGFALAGMLAKAAYPVCIVLLCGRKFSADASYYFDQLPSDVKIVENEFVSADIYVDAVFGTGFCGNLPENIVDIFEKVSKTPALKFAIDIPSGVNSDTGECSSFAFCADITVTFEILKFAHVLPKSRALCGEIFVKSIDLSKKAIDEAAFSAELLNGYILPRKHDDLHKGSNGTLFCIVGCKQYQGAATLSVKSALRGGCGIVTAFVPESVYLPLASKVDSAVIFSCAENKGGMHSSASILRIADEMQKRSPNAILAGCGMGVQHDTEEIIRFTLRQPIDCVIDGDGLRYVSPEYLIDRKNSTILTPHLGEFARMIRKDVETVAKNRFALGREYAVKNNCVLVLKDSVTVVSTPAGKQHVLSVPNAGMAKGGSGDVLAGLIASFLAQGLGAVEAAKAGVWYHSAAGQSALKKYGFYSMLPTDVINEISSAIKKV